MNAISATLLTGLATATLLANAPAQAEVRPEGNPTSMVALSHTDALAASAEQLVIVLKNGQRPTVRPDSTWLESENRRAGDLVQRVSRGLSHLRMMGDGAHVIRIDPGSSPADRLRLIEALKADPAVERVEIDRRIQPLAQGPLTGITNLLSNSARSWFHKAVTRERASSNSETMWTRYRGDSRSIVAVVDTGVIPNHPSLQGHLLPGFDMVADAFTANDGQSSVAGSSRDNDASDPGNGITAADLATRPECGSPSNSTWHGTFVAALVAGNPMPNDQIFPINWHGQILPVRALGRCGGFTSDLADAIRWSAGLPVPGTPINTNVASVINLSLGAVGACSSAIEGAAINEATARGIPVVAAAGNRGGSVDSPANCPGAISVGALDQEGLKASYSNFGTAVTVMAPGGDGAFPMWSASNSGVQGPLSNTYSSKIGTSFAAPLVASTISLMRSLNPSLSIAQITQLLQQTARPFLSLGGQPVCGPTVTSTACNCSRSQCGAGMLDAAAAINAARPNDVLANLTGPAVVSPGGNGRFDASESFNPGSGALTWSWRVVSFTGTTAPVIASPTASVTDITFPAQTRAAQLQLTVSNGSQSHSIIKNVTVAEVGTAQPDTLGALLSVVTGNVASSGDTAGLTGPGSNGTATGSENPAATSPAGGGGGGGQLPATAVLGLLAGMGWLRMTARRGRG